MKISFLLPCLIKIPVGGVKIIYRYAGELQKLGHEVTIISPKSEGYRLRHLIKAGAIRIRDRWHGVEDQPYYETPVGVEHLIIPAPDPKFIPDGFARLHILLQNFLRRQGSLSSSLQVFTQCLPGIG